MSELAIRAVGLSKQYRIGGSPQGYKTLRDSLTDVFVQPFRKAHKLLRGQATAAAGLDETIWALKDISFEVKFGELIGIVGLNGAGKSTLLKILSRITDPTTGYCDIYGRVGSLLEVGTGFHPELTGRENIYLNGAILGMTKSEINRKFDEIVAFAEIEKFIETPAKHYSSGMYMRLAFAVAAHLEPEILIVDEVLAVGDTRFQKKCLNKMQDIGKSGQTVIFVSHNMPAITRLCDRVILLEEGRVVKDGPSNEVVSEYLTSGISRMAKREWSNGAKAPSGDVARLLAVRVRNKYGEVADSIDIRKPIKIEIEYEVLKGGHQLLPNFQLYNSEDVNVFSAHDLDSSWRQRARPAGRYVTEAWIPGNLLSEGMMYINIGCETVDPRIFQFWVPNVVAFHVVDNGDADSARGDYRGQIQGIVRPLLKWQTQYRPNGHQISSASIS